MVTEVVNSNTQSVMERETLDLYSPETLDLYSPEFAQSLVRDHLYAQIEKIHANNTELKLKSLILSRDAQLHSHASSVPSLTVRKKNVVFPVNFPSQDSRQSTSPSIWIESLLWNLINTMELDAPCRGLKLKKFRTMISNVADIFHTSIRGHFDKLKSNNLEDHSDLSDLFYYSEYLLKATQRFRNLDVRKTQIINYCSKLLVLMHKLHHKGLEANVSEQDVSKVQNNQEEVKPMQNDLLLEPSISTSLPSQDLVNFNCDVVERSNEPPHDSEKEANGNTLAEEFKDKSEERAISINEVHPTNCHNSTKNTQRPKITQRSAPNDRPILLNEVHPTITNPTSRCNSNEPNPTSRYNSNEPNPTSRCNSNEPNSTSRCNSNETNPTKLQIFSTKSTQRTSKFLNEEHPTKFQNFSTKSTQRTTKRFERSMTRIEELSDTSSDSSSDSDTSADSIPDSNSTLDKFSEIDAVSEEPPTQRKMLEEPLTLSIPVKRFEEDFVKDSKSISDAPTVLDFIAKRREIMRERFRREQERQIDEMFKQYRLDLKKYDW